MKYLRKFQSRSEYDSFIESNADYPNVCLVSEEDAVIYNKESPFSLLPFFVKAIEDITVKYNSNNTSYFKYEYSKDNTTWLSAGVTNLLSINAGEIVFFRSYARGEAEGNSSAVGIGDFDITGLCNVGGNVMSLIYGANFKDKRELTEDSQFFRLFYASSSPSIVDASNLFLPATTLTKECYYGMFEGQKVLVAPPKLLPATELAEGCYRDMFYGCTSLTAAPELPATTLAGNCYYRMFYKCYSLVNAPALPATTLANYCYYQMFGSCYSLVNAPALPATTLAKGCYKSMFDGCESLTTAPLLPATTLAEECYATMFAVCTSLTTTPTLPATTLARGCYSSMFYRTDLLPDCTNIDFSSYSTIASGGLIGLFGGTKLKDKDLSRILPVNAEGKYYLPATTLAKECYYNMFRGCHELRTAPLLPATSLAEGCYKEMFKECFKLVTAPELPATVLVNECYNYMFERCGWLTSIKAMFLTAPDSEYTRAWVFDVASSGTFIKNSAATWENTFGVSAIPEGWTVEYADA